MKQLARKVSEYLGQEMELDQDTRDIITFGLETLLVNLVGLAGALTLSWLLDCLPVTLLLIILAVVLRFVAGGAHLSSAWRCAILTTAIFPMLAKLSIYMASVLHSNVVLPVILGNGLLALVVFWRLAPVDTPAKPIRTMHHQRRLKKLSMLFALGLIVIQLVLYFTGNIVLVLALSIGLLWQTFVISRPGQWLMEGIDVVFGKVIRV
ncbi:MAG: accessory gene regulator B family protein [Peptococcaceae bacterium]|nr:accessory gene regulator B family protein [Peptococcaceae bacterium]